MDNKFDCFIKKKIIIIIIITTIIIILVHIRTLLWTHFYDSTKQHGRSKLIVQFGFSS